VAFGVAGVGLLLVLGLAVYGYTTLAAPFSQLDLADRLATAVVPLLAVLLLGLLARRPGSGRAAAPALEAQPGGVAGADPVGAAAREPDEDPALAPTWSADTAAGAAWTTAGEAATGRPATGWGTPAGTGWEVRPALEAPQTAEPPADQGGQSTGGEVHPWGRPAP
jgi:hypothetical protein